MTSSCPPLYDHPRSARTSYSPSSAGKRLTAKNIAGQHPPSTSRVLYTSEKDKDFMKELDEMADSVLDKASHFKTQDEIERLRAEIDSDYTRHRIKLNTAYLASVYARIDAHLSDKEKRLNGKPGLSHSDTNSPSEGSAPPPSQTSSTALSPYCPIVPGQFKTTLLPVLSDRSAVTGALISHGCHDDGIFIYLDEETHTHYTLLSSSDVFEGPAFDEDNEEEAREQHGSGSVYWRLQSKGRGWFVAPTAKSEDGKEQWVAEANEGDVFVPLGWLVERNEGGFHRTTRYVCTLNISTKPISFWLVYDYGVLETLLATAVTPVPPGPRTCYHDPAADHGHADASCPKVGDQAKKCKEEHSSHLSQTALGYLNQSGPWDIARLYSNAANEWPTGMEKAKGQASTPHFLDLAGVGLRARQIQELPGDLAARLEVELK